MVQPGRQRSQGAGRGAIAPARLAPTGLLGAPPLRCAGGPGTEFRAAAAMRTRRYAAAWAWLCVALLLGAPAEGSLAAVAAGGSQQPSGAARKLLRESPEMMGSRYRDEDVVASAYGPGGAPSIDKVSKYESDHVPEELTEREIITVVVIVVFVVFGALGCVCAAQHQTAIAVLCLIKCLLGMCCLHGLVGETPSDGSAAAGGMGGVDSSGSVNNLGERAPLVPSLGPKVQQAFSKSEHAL